MDNSHASPHDAPSSFLLTESGTPSAFMQRLGEEAYEVAQELGQSVQGSLDSIFVAFLRLTSRFGVFSFGPVTLYVPTIEEVARRTSRAAVDSEWLVRMSNLLIQEERRLGGPANELHVLLMLMKIREGLPARVFGELGVRPEEVEEYARSAGSARRDAPLDKLYSPEEAAEYLGIHVQTVRAWIRSGRLKASRLTGQRALRIKASDLRTVLEPVEPEESGLQSRW